MARIGHGLAMSLAAFAVLVVCATPASAQAGTPGFWKNHADSTSRHYATTWDLIGGPEVEFFKTGDSWLDVLNTPPEGNAYYILANQYVAAQLNVLYGAVSVVEAESATDGSQINLVVDHARSLFEINEADSALLDDAGSGSAELELVRAAVRQDFINTAFVLDQFNNAVAEAMEELEEEEEDD
jgi:hypothetical protein